MGPPPRSLAAEAHVCFMVRPHTGPTEYKFVARASAPQGGLPSVRLLCIGGIAAKPSPPNRRQTARCGIYIPLRNGEPCLPQRRQMEDKHAFSNGEGQARCPARRPVALLPPLARSRRPMCRRASEQMPDAPTVFRYVTENQTCHEVASRKVSTPSATLSDRHAIAPVARPSNNFRWSATADRRIAAPDRSAGGPPS